MHGLSSRQTRQGHDMMHYSSHYSTVGLACGSSPFNDVPSTDNRAHQNPHLNPSLGKCIPSHSSTAGLGCSSSPFNDDSSPRNPFLSPYDNYKLLGNNRMHDTACPRAVPPIFLPTESMMNEYWKMRRGYCYPSLCRESFHYCYTLICHCSHLPCQKRPRIEQGNACTVAQNTTTSGITDLERLETSEWRNVEYKSNPNRHICPSPFQKFSKLSFKAATKTQESSLETVKVTENGRLQNNIPKHSSQSMKRTSLETKHNYGKIITTTRPSMDTNMRESLKVSDDEVSEPTYLGNTKESNESWNVMRVNQHQKCMHTSSGHKFKSNDTTRLAKHFECQSPRNEDHKRTTLLRQSETNVSLKDSRSRREDHNALNKVRRLEKGNCDSPHNKDTNQPSRVCTETQKLHSQELGNATRKQTITTPGRVQNACDSSNKQRPPDSNLSSHEASDDDIIVLSSTPLNQDKDQDPAFKNVDLGDNDWAGYGYDHRDLPKIVAVHTIVKNRDECAHKNEVGATKQLTTNEKEVWNQLLDDLASSSADGWHEVERITSSPDGCVPSSFEHYASATPSMVTVGLIEKQRENKKFLPSKQPDKKRQSPPKKFPGFYVHSAQSGTRCSHDNLHSEGSMVEVSLVKTSTERQNETSSTITVHSQRKSDHNVEKKWTIKELLPSNKPRPSTARKPQSVSKSEAVEKLQRSILEAEQKIEEEKINWKKNILYKLKKVLISRLRKLDEKAEKTPV